MREVRTSRTCIIAPCDQALKWHQSVAPTAGSSRLPKRASNKLQPLASRSFVYHSPALAHWLAPFASFFTSCLFFISLSLPLLPYLASFLFSSSSPLSKSVRKKHLSRRGGGGGGRCKWTLPSAHKAAGNGPCTTASLEQRLLSRGKKGCGFYSQFLCVRIGEVRTSFYGTFIKVNFTVHGRGETKCDCTRRQTYLFLQKTLTLTQFGYLLFPFSCHWRKARGQL